MNSLTSAPAMKPEALAERITTPRGGFCRNAARCVSSSSRESRDSALVEVPGRSKLSQAMLSPSVCSAQEGVAVEFIGSLLGDRGLRRITPHVEVAKDGTVIGEPDVG